MVRGQVRVTLGGGLQHVIDWQQVRVQFMSFSFYKYVVGVVKGYRRNIFHERLACGFLQVVLRFTFALVMSGME